MARIVARNAGIVLGARNISARSNTAALSITSEAPEVTSFTETTRTRVPGGLSDVELTLDGFWDSAASQVDELFSGSLGASAWCAFYPAGATVCNPGKEFTGIITEYSQNAAVADAVTTSLTVTGCAPLLVSKILSACSLAESSSTAGVGVDFGGALTGTAYGIIRILSVAGADPTISSSIQSSEDDETYVTLADCAGSAVGNTVSIVTLTNPLRYRRFKWIVTDGSANVVVSCGSSLIT